MSFRFSIITIVFNNVRHIGDCLSSVKSQDFDGVEHLVMDGGSTDGTLDIISQFKNSNLKFCSGPDLGIYDALNSGISLATGEIIGILHSDDIFSDSNVLQDVYAVFADPKVDFVYGDLLYVRSDDTNSVVRNWVSGAFNAARLKFGWMPPHTTVFVRRSVFEKFGLYNINFRISSDYDFILRVLSSGELKVVYLPRILVKMRVGGISNSGWSNFFVKFVEDYTVAAKYFFLPFFVVALKRFRKIGQYWF